MKQPYELWVLAEGGREPDAIERCVQAAGYRMAGLAQSVTELRVRMAQHRADPAQHAPPFALLVDAASLHDPDTRDAVADLVRAGLPVVRLAPEPSSELPADAAPADAAPADADAGHVMCALVPRELVLAVELAVARQALARAERECERCQEDSRQLNRALARRAAELQAVSDELESLGFSISHDLRAPLRAIDGLGKLMLERLDDRLDPRIQAYLQHICEASQRMSRLIGELLALSRLMRREMHVQTCDLSAMARDILDGLQRSAPGRDVQVVVTPGIQVRADPTLLGVALENLLDNAWKFTARNELALIEVGVTSRDGQPAYFVRDNGAGFDMANAEKLFGAFQRMHGAHEFEGTGIGLAKVLRIVRRHGGDVWAEAVVGRGATFTFTLS